MEKQKRQNTTKGRRERATETGDARELWQKETTVSDGRKRCQRVTAHGDGIGRCGMGDDEKKYRCQNPMAKEGDVECREGGGSGKRRRDMSEGDGRGR